MENAMTIEQAYQAMIAFMEYYISHGFDELKPLLEDMKLVGDAKTKKPELWNEWLDAVRGSREKRIRGYPITLV